MMAKIHGRVSKAAGFRAGSVALDTIKGRQKPYKTEQKTILARKRKLDLHTSYTKAPQGYSFLPVGAPDLADRCKELSRQRGYAVNIVNAKPVSRFAQDPDKVSHHIHRIGYHFRSEIVDEARDQLGYILHNGRFVKEEDLAEQYSQDRMATIMAKHGLHVGSHAMQETPAQVRAAIKELFPRIPTDDLDQIVHHAWEEGSHRVGTNAMLELPRRVQLAVIARIRHAHTDYDRLLRAFEWKEARAEVEPECLRKLIEWRGETEDGDDNELEEIVRETIVIDDDEDERAEAEVTAEADDEESASDHDDGSDATVEVIHVIAKDGDFAAESMDDRAIRYRRRASRWQRTLLHRSVIARQKIDAAKQQIRDIGSTGHSSSHHSPPLERSTSLLERQAAAATVQVLPVEQRHLPETIVMNGQFLRRATADVQRHQFVRARDDFEVSAHPPYPANLSISRLQPSKAVIAPEEFATPRDHAVPSIEWGTYHASAMQITGSSTNRPLPVTPNHSSRRRKPTYVGIETRPIAVVDLTTPPRELKHPRSSPSRHAYNSTSYHHHDSHQHLPPARGDQGLPYAPYPSALERHSTAFNDRLSQPTQPSPYDPRQPFVPMPNGKLPPDERLTSYGRDLHHAFTSKSSLPAAVQTQLLDSRSAQSDRQTTHTMNPQRRLVYGNSSARSGSTSIGQPIHGAPAPIQQVSWGGPNASSAIGLASPNYRSPQYLDRPSVPPPGAPAEGAPHPAQMYSH